MDAYSHEPLICWKKKMKKKIQNKKTNDLDSWFAVYQRDVSANVRSYITPLWLTLAFCSIK